MRVAIKNPKSGEIKGLKVGWSWTLFLFSGFFGLPLFLRRLYVWGAVLLALWVVQVAVPPLLPLTDQIAVYLVLSLLFLGFGIFLGIKGNEMTAKNYLENDWVFADATSAATNFAKNTWGLSTSATAGQSRSAVAVEQAQASQNPELRNGDPQSTKSIVDYGPALLGIPVVGALLAWFWVGNMNLLQSPESSLALVVLATVCGTAILAAMEASKATKTIDQNKGSYSPVQWFFIVALIWVIGYPAYLLKRRQYGLRNYIGAGVAVMLVFASSAALIDYSIESRVSEFGKAMSDLGNLSGVTKENTDADESDADESIFAKLGRFIDRKAGKSADPQAITRVQAKVTAILTEIDPLKTVVAEYYAVNGEWVTCAQIVGGCTAHSTIGAGAQITASLDSAGDESLRGKSIVWTPHTDSDNDVLWDCSSNADPIYIPTACRHPIVHPSISTSSTPAITTPVNAPNTVESGAATDSVPPPSSIAPPPSAIASPPSAIAPVTATGVGDVPNQGDRAQVVAPSFDCAKAGTAVEKMICGTPQLAKADAELAGFYKRNLVVIVASSGAANVEAMKNSQRAFIKQRNQCATVACVSEAYRARWEEIAQLGYVKE